MRKRNRLFWIAKAILLGALMIVLVGSVVMFLWNNVVADIFVLPALTWIQALGLFVLAKILFGGGHGWKGRMGGGHSWKSKWKQRWENMDPEARERACKHFKHKWYGAGDAAEVETEGAEKKEENL